MRLNRRQLLGWGAVAGAAAVSTAGLSGCGSNVSISQDPNELVLWLWNRSASPELLAEAAEQIPGTDKRLRADYIGTTFDTKVRTSLAAGAYIPDLTYINSNNALYFPSEDLFVDMFDLGAREREADFYPWKWQLGLTPTDRMCFYPLDIGPTGYYYRADIFEQAGLPSDPEQVSAAMTTWEDWIEVGKELRGSADAGLMNTATGVFNQYIYSSDERYFDRQDKPLFEVDGNSIRAAWDTAVTAIGAGVVSNAQTATDQNAAFVSGKTAGNMEAAWWAEILVDTAPETDGDWRIARQPVKAGNSGGSFVAIPTTCKDPEAAFALISWMQSPENQVRTFNDVQLFPSTPASFESGDMKPKNQFFGDQNPLDFFSAAAETVPTAYISTYESQIEAFATELTNVSTSGKDPEVAWREAVDEVNRVLRKRGAI